MTDRLSKPSETTEITRILARIQAGDDLASGDLWPIVYDELRKLANFKMRTESKTSLKPTELVHEAYLRLVDVEQVQHWKSRSHFFGAAAEAMRRILVETARSRAAIKRGGNAKRIDLDNLIVDDDYMQLVLWIDEALSELEEHEPTAAAIAKLRIFGGMGHVEAANAMGISRRAADRQWVIARTRLYKVLADSDMQSESPFGKDGQA